MNEMTEYAMTHDSRTCTILSRQGTTAHRLSHANISGDNVKIRKRSPLLHIIGPSDIEIQGRVSFYYLMLPKIDSVVAKQNVCFAFEGVLSRMRIRYLR